MSNPAHIIQAKRDLNVIHTLQGLPPGFFKALKIIGVIIILSGLQAYGFYRHFIADATVASRSLAQLTGEVASNTRVDSMLAKLADLRRVTENEILQTEIVQTYERFVNDFLEDRRTAIEDFARVISTFSVQSSSLEEEALVALKAELTRLEELYRNNYGELLADYESPPVYMQPTAAIIKRDKSFVQNINFNHALYLSLVGDRSAANTIFNELKSEVQDTNFLSRIHYAQARMLYDAFLTQNNMEYYQQTIQNVQESLRKDPAYGMPKVFLEYLLSLERGMSTEDVPQQGEGSGEAEGERGVMSSHPPTF